MDIVEYLDTFKDMATMYSYSPEGEFVATGWGKFFMVISKLPYAKDDFDQVAVSPPYNMMPEVLRIPPINPPCTTEFDTNKIRWISRISDKLPLFLISGNKENGLLMQSTGLMDENETEHGFYSRNMDAFSLFDASIIKNIGKLFLKHDVRKLILSFGQNTALKFTTDKFTVLVANMEYTKYDEEEKKKIQELIKESSKDQPITLDSFEVDE